MNFKLSLSILNIKKLISAYHFIVWTLQLYFLSLISLHSLYSQNSVQILVYNFLRRVFLHNEAYKDIPKLLWQNNFPITCRFKNHKTKPNKKFPNIYYNNTELTRQIANYKKILSIQNDEGQSLPLGNSISNVINVNWLFVLYFQNIKN